MPDRSALSIASREAYSASRRSAWPPCCPALLNRRIKRFEERRFRCEGAVLYALVGVQSRHISRGTCRSRDRRNCRDGTAPSRSPALRAGTQQSIPAPDRCSTRGGWASPGGGWKKSSPHSATSAMLLVTVSQYQGVFASVIAHRPGTSVNTRPDRLPPSENIGVRRSSSANPNGRFSDQPPQP